MPNLWPDSFDTQLREDSQAIQILQEQVSYFEEKTNGKIKVLFSPIDRTLSRVTAISRMIAEGMSEKEKEDELLEGKQNLNELFDTHRYRFELYNDTYRFRMFTLINRLQFPIEVHLDGGIAEELSISECVKVESNSEFTDLIGSVFSTHKVARIITHMLQVPSSNSEQTNV